MADHDAAATVFPRLWAALLACGFASIAAQIPTTFGHAGLLPVSATAAPPSLLAVQAPDAALYALTGLGMLASVAAALGWRPLRAWALAILSWWQLSAASPALGLPPDFVMLHGAIAAALMTQARTRTSGIWLAWALFFGLYFEAGLVKATHGTEGREWMLGSGMQTFFEVAPLPGPLALTLHSLPHGVHVAMTWAGLLGQLIVPWLVFAGRWGRLAAFCWFSAFQVLLIAGANFGLLLWGSLALGITLLDDHFLPVSLRRPAADDQLTLGFGRRSFALLIGAWLLQAGIDHTGVGRGSAVREGLEQWRLATLYGMFDSIPQRRVEWAYHVVNADGQAGERLLLPDQLDPDATTGRFLGPHHPRIPFFLWFHNTIQEHEDWERAARDFPGATERITRATAVARYTGAWLCSRPTSTGDLPERLQLQVQVVHLGAGDGPMWTSELLAASPPADCSRLRAEALTPYAGSEQR